MLLLPLLLLLLCQQACCAIMSQVLYGSELSHLSIVLSAAAYSTNASGCFANSGLSKLGFGQLTNVTFKKVPQPEGGGKFDWAGFVGRLPASRLTVVAYRGTVDHGQLIDEIKDVLREPPVASPIGGKVQAYFARAQRAVWAALEPAFKALRAAEPHDAVLITGHSLGAAMAAQAAAELAHAASQRASPESGGLLAVYTFGEPRLGDANFAKAFDRLVPNSWRIVHGSDPVVHLPFCRGLLEHCDARVGSGPYHHGTEVFYPPKQKMLPSLANYKICLGEPKNEDRLCADSPGVIIPCLRNPKKCIDSHLIYYGIHVGQWWNDSKCKPA